MKKHRHGKNYKKKRKDRIIHEDEGERRYSNVLVRMIEVFKPKGEDWMGFKVSKKNDYTFHHIREKRIGGKAEFENGAILTERAHQFLNTLDYHYHNAYDDYQKIFKMINKNRGPIPDDLLEDIYGMMLDIFYYNEYHMSKNELDYYEQFTYVDKPKVKIKKL